MHVQPDHLVVFCHSLDQGSAWCEATLGVAPVEGGRHALMGTHNRLLKLSSPTQADTYLELLAIDPEAPPPGRARWFGIDDAGLQARVREAPELIAWVGRSPQVDMHRWGLITIGQAPGTIVAASRDTPRGLLQWQIVLREDGALPLGGVLPVLIEWKGVHPAQALPDSGVGLRELTVRGLPPRAVEVMRLRGVTRLAEAESVLSVRLDTPLGERVLRSAA